jgi:hypothetical protein
MRIHAMYAMGVSAKYWYEESRDWLPATGVVQSEASPHERYRCYKHTSSINTSLKVTSSEVVYWPPWYTILSLQTPTMSTYICSQKTGSTFYKPNAIDILKLCPLSW